MGGCASKPTDLDLDMCQPAPVQSETPEEKVEEQIVPQESTNEAEAKTEDEKPLVDLSEPAEEALKAEETNPESTEEVKTEVAAATEEEEEEKKEAVADEVSEISSDAPKA